MDNLQIYEAVSKLSSRMVTEKYSTSFSAATRLFAPEIRQHIYNIYGFVRFADEIVDTFHNFDKQKLLQNFERDFRETLNIGISLNPVMNSFCGTVLEKKIPLEFVDAFLHSMKMDLGEIRNLDDIRYREYIYGSAEVVGLMCLKVFVEGNDTEYERLKPHAKSLGAAFQKINFLRDISTDFSDLKRTYFPDVDFQNFTQLHKQEIEMDIAKDFAHALVGIRKLPISSRIAVYLAYKYYIHLFKKICACRPQHLMKKRIRISNARKAYLMGEMLIMKNFKVLP